MSRLIILTLTDEERIALEKGSRHGTSHAFRTRCQMILLKADRLPSAQVAEQIGCCMIAVNGWVKRYQAEGIHGLKTKQGRGRKAILDDRSRSRAGAGCRAEPPPEDQPRQSRTRSEPGQRVQHDNAQAFSQKHRCRYKRLRKRPKGQPNPDVYALRVECLAELERLSEQGHLDLFYGDESGVTLEPCVPYAWQFADERVCLPAAKGGGLNCFALLSRDNRCLTQTTPEAITGDFVADAARPAFRCVCPSRR